MAKFLPWMTLIACAAFVGGSVAGYALALRDFYCLGYSEEDPQACVAEPLEVSAAVALDVANIDRPLKETNDASRD